MADENILNDLSGRENELLQITLISKTTQAAVKLEEFVEASLTLGVSREAVREQLLNDLETGGPIFGDLRRQLKESANGTVNRLRDAGQMSEHGFDNLFRWSAVLVNTCNGGNFNFCEFRHGQVKTYEEWQELGLPRTGRTVCQQHCRCMLIPAEFTEVQKVKVEARK